MTFATVLPMAVVMVAGPQIVSAILLATSENPRRASLAFLAGVALAVTLAVSVAYYVAELGHSAAGKSHDSGVKTTIDWLVLVLLLVLIVLVFRRRKNTEPPGWMSKLQTATPKFSFGLGFLLFLAFPTDIITTVTVGAYLSRHDESWWEFLPFLGLTLLLAGLPLILLLLLRSKAQEVLPRVRSWISKNSWIVSEVVIIFFLVNTISSLVND